MILDKKCTIYTLQSDETDTDKEGFALLKGQNITIHIQPVDAEIQALFGEGSQGKMYQGFTTYTGVVINDIVSVSGTVTYSGMEYIVRGVENFNFAPLPHMELTLMERG